MSNFDIAIKRLTDLYGNPNWFKDGQDIDEIKKVWESELNGYTEEQIKEACYKLFRFRKAMTFPTISQVMSMLYDEEKPKEASIYESKTSRCPELELYELVRPQMFFGKFRAKFMNMYNDFKAYFPECSADSFSDTIKAMKMNGWWENKITEYLN